MSGPSHQRVDLNPGQSTSVMLLPGKYRVAAVIDGEGTLLFFGEQRLESGLKYASHFVVPAN